MPDDAVPRDCPFCGRESKVGTIGEAFFVACMNYFRCNATGSYKKTRQEAVEDWIREREAESQNADAE